MSPCFFVWAFLRSKMSSSGNPHPVPKPLPNAFPRGLVQGRSRHRLSYYSRSGPLKTLSKNHAKSKEFLKNGLKRASQITPPRRKKATKKELRVTQMNHSELSNFTHVLSRNRLRKGQNWEQNWDGFGWGKDKESRSNSLVQLIIA